MTLRDILKESMLSINGSKTRSALTVLGIIIGVMAVVIMVAVGETVKKQIDEEFSVLGTNSIMIRSGAVQKGGVWAGATRNTLTIDDSLAIKKLPDVIAITPLQNSNAQIVYGNKNWKTLITGGNPDMSTYGIEIEKGTFFNESDVRNASTVAVLGPDVAIELGLPDDPIGQIIRISNIPFIVVGVVKPRGDSVMGNADDIVMMPITTMRKRLQGGRFPDSVQMIALKISPDAENEIVTDQIKALLRQRHRLKDDAEDDFQIMDSKQLMNTMDTITGFMKMLLVSIAGISLLVGSIGIMNMMLVSVAERTHEIGTRKAIGAKESHIIIQFLSESVMISFIGSIIGLVLGIAISQIVGRLILGFEVPISIWSLVMSVCVAIFVGIASGVMPAIKAAKLNPIDALRHE